MELDLNRQKTVENIFSDSDTDSYSAFGLSKNENKKNLKKRSKKKVESDSDSSEDFQKLNKYTNRRGYSNISPIKLHHFCKQNIL